MWHKEPFDDLTLLSAQYVSQVFPRHTHASYSIGINENATTAFFCRGELRLAPAGTITIVNPGEVHTGQAIVDRTWGYRCFYPSPLLLTRIASEVYDTATQAPFFPSPVIDDPDLACLLVQVHEHLEVEPQVESDCGLNDALGRLVARYAQPCEPHASIQNERPAVRCAREYIDVNYKRTFSLASLAEVVGLSRFHLLRLFRAEIGLTPGEYQTQVRIEEAKQLLAQGIRISFVAAEVGFADQSHFTRRFKRWVGVTPGRYLQ